MQYKPQKVSCQNQKLGSKYCEGDFTIEPEDFVFYEKIKVPPPTFCPQCRQMRRYAWRNERTLYKRNCDLCSKSIITVYSEDKPFQIYCGDCWWSDKWDARDYAIDYDFSKSFFDQFNYLQKKVPRIALISKGCTDSLYTNHSGYSRSLYMAFNSWYCENIMYSSAMVSARDCVDCYRIEEKPSENLYECIFCFASYNCQYCFWVNNSFDCYYSFDLKNCNNCFLSFNLRNKSYCFLNEQLSREEYHRRVKEFDLGSHKARQELYLR